MALGTACAPLRPTGRSAVLYKLSHPAFTNNFTCPDNPSEGTSGFTISTCALRKVTVGGIIVRLGADKLCRTGADNVRNDS